MADHSRIEDLRRRVEKDPASIAFAQLAEEYRRAGHYADAIRVCRTGLTRHPSYLSARVTLGRALIETNDLAGARAELETVLRSAPENLAAVRGLAEIHHRQGDPASALVHYRAALALVRHDPDLEQTIADLERELTAKPKAVSTFSLEDLQAEFLGALPGSKPAAQSAPAAVAPPPAPVAPPAPAAGLRPPIAALRPLAAAAAAAAPPPAAAAAAASAPPPAAAPLDPQELAALETFLHNIVAYRKALNLPSGRA